MVLLCSCCSLFFDGIGRTTTVLMDQCDPITDPHINGDLLRHCLLPFPNDFHTIQDDATPTKLRLSLNPSAMPRFRSSFFPSINLSEWSMRDGWGSSGPLIVSGLTDKVILKWSGLNHTEALLQSGILSFYHHPCRCIRSNPQSRQPHEYCT